MSLQTPTDGAPGGSGGGGGSLRPVEGTPALPVGTKYIYSATQVGLVGLGNVIPAAAMGFPTAITEAFGQLAITPPTGNPGDPVYMIVTVDAPGPGDVTIDYFDSFFAPSTFPATSYLMVLGT